MSAPDPLPTPESSSSDFPSIRDRLSEAVSKAVATVAGEEGLDLAVDPTTVHLERPAQREHGDWSTNVAMVAAKEGGEQSPRPGRVAGRRARAPTAPPLVAVEVAGPGFINFRLDDGWLHEALEDVLDQGENGYARPMSARARRVQVEFISANPTGPIHVGNGWWGTYGDALARLLEPCGYRVSREYYVNDTGGQIRSSGESLLARRRARRCPRAATRASTSPNWPRLRRPRRRDRGRPLGGGADPRRIRATLA